MEAVVDLKKAYLAKKKLEAVADQKKMAYLAKKKIGGSSWPKNGLLSHFFWRQ